MLRVAKISKLEWNKRKQKNLGKSSAVFFIFLQKKRHFQKKCLLLYGR